MNPLEDIAIWWTSYKDKLYIGANLPKTFPDYMHEMWRQRFPNSSKERLLRHDSFKNAPTVTLDKYETVLHKSLHDSDCVGIMVRAFDLGLLITLPGMVTTLLLDRWRREVMSEQIRSTQLKLALEGVG